MSKAIRIGLFISQGLYIGTPIRFEFSLVPFQAKKVADQVDCCCNSKTQGANHKVKEKMKYSSEESINHVITEVPKAEEESFDDDVDEESRCVHKKCKKWHLFNLSKPFICYY